MTPWRAACATHSHMQHTYQRAAIHTNPHINALLNTGNWALKPGSIACCTALGHTSSYKSNRNQGMAALCVVIKIDAPAPPSIWPPRWRVYKLRPDNASDGQARVSCEKHITPQPHLEKHGNTSPCHGCSMQWRAWARKRACHAASSRCTHALQQPYAHFLPHARLFAWIYVTYAVQIQTRRNKESLGGWTEGRRGMMMLMWAVSSPAHGVVADGCTCTMAAVLACGRR